MDLASKYPQSRFDGIDIDLSQTPPSPWLPENVAFRQWDVTFEVPPDMVAKYEYGSSNLPVEPSMSDFLKSDQKASVVNIRLFMLIVQDNNPEPILQNALKLLSTYNLNVLVVHHSTHAGTDNRTEPGGWLQWSDYDPGTKNIVSASPDTSIDAFKAVAQFPTSLKVTKGDPRLRAR